MTPAVRTSALALVACASLNAFAGPAAAPEAKTIVEEPEPWFNGSVAVGYDSRYYFRGLWFADHIAWGSVGLNFPITKKFTLGLSALYTSTVQTNVNATFQNEELDYSELDLGVALTYNFDFASVSLLYTNYSFFDGFSGTANPSGRFGAGETNINGTNELGVKVVVPWGPVNFQTGYYYDFNIGGSYLEAGVDYTYQATPWLGIVPSVTAGYGFDYYSFGAQNAITNGVKDGFTHLLVKIATPVKITKTATLTPYAACNISGRARDANNVQDTEFFGGVSLSVTF